MKIIFFVMHLNLRSFSDSSIFFLSFELMNFIYENKKNYFQIIFLICATLHDSSPLFDSIILIILIYICLLIFQVLYLNIVNNFLFIY
jgi:hypothetical protein